MLSKRILFSQALNQPFSFNMPKHGNIAKNHRMLVTKTVQSNFFGCITLLLTYPTKSIWFYREKVHKRTYSDTRSPTRVDIRLFLIYRESF